jgi:DNA-binding MarR family transcriptional regulator
MKNLLDHINKIFESRIRLGLMSLLMVHDSMDFNSIKETLQLSDGNLASHISALEKAEYITISKEFVGKKTKTSYKATESGKKAFRDHIDALENLINSQPKS